MINALADSLKLRMEIRIQYMLKFVEMSALFLGKLQHQRTDAGILGHLGYLYIPRFGALFGFLRVLDRVDRIAERIVDHIVKFICHFESPRITSNHLINRQINEVKSIQRSLRRSHRLLVQKL